MASAHRGLEFDEEAIRAYIAEFWRERVDDDPLGGGGQTGTIFDLLPAMDSLTALEVLHELQEIAGCSLPSATVQQGGYRTREQMEKSMLSAIRRSKAKRGSE